MTDLKLALRQMLKNPGFTAVAILMLALGIGANTAVFSVARAVLFRPLGFAAAERLVAIRWVLRRLLADRPVSPWIAWCEKA